MKRRRGRIVNYSSKEEEEKGGYDDDDDTTNTTTTITRRICFWGLNDDSRCDMDWFVLKLSIDLQQQLTREVRQLSAFDHSHLHPLPTNKKHEKGITPLTPIFSHWRKSEGGNIPFWGNSMATLGPFLYSVGGSFYYRTLDYGSHHTSPKEHRNRSNLVYHFDTTNAGGGGGWIQAPSMITPRISPQILTLNSKLYVFGCSRKARKCRHKPRCRVWAESFDPSVGRWTALPEPEFSKTLVICSPTIPNKILAIADKKYAYEFDTETNCWNFKFNFPKLWEGNERHSPVVVGDLLYWFDADIHAYDMRTDKIYTGPVQDMCFQRCMRTYHAFGGGIVPGKLKPVIFHMGGCYFSLLLHDFGMNLELLPYDAPRHFHFLTILVSTTNKLYKRYGVPGLDICEFFLRASVVSCQCFPIDRTQISLDGRFTM